VILAVVGYFYFIGRYGVRVGDRITLAGVTGRVVEIGLVRIYLMELAGPELHPTGRIVVLSNAVLFQPQAMFKEVPGAAYQWHTVRVMLAPSVDVEQAHKRLLGAANQVYERHKVALQQGHAAVQRLTDYDSAPPTPDVQVGYAEKGLRFEIRYPVVRAEAATIDMRMLEAVRTAVAQEPPLPVVDSKEPELQTEAA
jgi:small-conductance mechanosensitive channel